MAAFTIACQSLSGRAAIARRPAAPRARPAAAASARPVVAVADGADKMDSAAPTRRGVLGGSAAAAFLPLVTGVMPSLGAVPKATAMVGEYLPKADVLDMVKFTVGAAQTPSLRAGTIPNPYYFYLPPTFLTFPVANAINGNYCQPRCDEPWTEVLFADDNKGKVGVIATGLEKITRGKFNVQIDYFGGPKDIMDAFAANLTGDIPVEDEEIVSMEAVKKGDQLYYIFELDVPYSNYGQHQLSSVTFKGESCVILTYKCTAKQWALPGVQQYAREVVKSFTI